MAKANALTWNMRNLLAMFPDAWGPPPRHYDKGTRKALVARGLIEQRKGFDAWRKTETGKLVAAERQPAGDAPL